MQRRPLVLAAALAACLPLAGAHAQDFPQKTGHHGCRLCRRRFG
jgi:hypothetical protein